MKYDISLLPIMYLLVYYISVPISNWFICYNITSAMWLPMIAPLRNDEILFYLYIVLGILYYSCKILTTAAEFKWSDVAPPIRPLMSLIEPGYKTRCVDTYDRGLVWARRTRAVSEFLNSDLQDSWTITAAAIKGIKTNE